jgi:uncharacterized spore protein YtfJ
MENVQQLLDAFTDLRKKAKADVCFGKPAVAEGRTVIPVAEVAYDFDVEHGTSAETEPAEQAGGGGGGASVHPLAVIEVTPQGTSVKPIIDEQKLALAGGLLAGWAVFWLAWALTRILGTRRQPPTTEEDEL